MPSPFPGMDPYLEHPALWPDVHNSLIAALREALAPQVSPRYYIGLEHRVYQFAPDDLVFIGRPDLTVTGTPAPGGGPVPRQSEVAVLEVEVPLTDELRETFLEVREVSSGQVVTILELLSPANKSGGGRGEYLRKRTQILHSQTSLVEIDLLRSGEPMPVVHSRLPPSHYRILVSRGSRRPRASLSLFSVRNSIPKFSLPLGPGDREPEVDLHQVLNDLYDRVHFELLVDYSRPCFPDLDEDDQGWAHELITRSSRPGPQAS